MTETPILRRLNDIDEERVVACGKERARFRMLFSADRTATHSMTFGIARVGPGEPLPLHQHAHAEIYLAVSGEVRVTVEEDHFHLTEGSAIFIPGNTKHSVHAADEAQLLFAFAADSYAEVSYVYFDDE